MLRGSAGLTCAALVLASSSLALAGTTPKQTGTAVLPATYVLRVGSGTGSYAGKIIVTLHFSDSASWAYDPVSGALGHLPTPVDNVNPIGGIGIAVKRNPGGSAERLIGGLNADGVATFVPKVPAGSYDIVVSVPAHAIKTEGTGGTRVAATKPVTLTLHFVVNHKGVLHTDPIRPANAMQGGNTSQ